MTWRPFNEARKFARSLKLKNSDDWRKYFKSVKRPNDIPSNPNFSYKKEWISWGDFLGTGYIAQRYRQYQPFKQAIKFVHSLGFKSYREWLVYCKSGKKPKDIPAYPSGYYKNKGWTNTSDWLGTHNEDYPKKEYRSFKDAKKFVRSLKLKGAKNSWGEYSKSGKRPNDIPSNPNLPYKKEWKGWGDFIGTGNVHPALKSASWLPFPEAKKVYRELIKKYKIKNWRTFAKKHKKLLEKLNLPARPDLIYTKEKVWSKMKK